MVMGIRVLAAFQGDSGTFTLKTDQPDQVSISPEEGKQTQEVTLTALFKVEKSLFDYEFQQDDPFTIVVSAMFVQFYAFVSHS